MGPLTYSLCQKPVLGLMMYLSSACSFPPLFHGESLPLQQVSASFAKEFEAPVSKPYFLLLNFHFGSAASIRSDEVVGSRHDESCERDYSEISVSQRAGLGRVIPIHVLIRDKRTGTVTIDRVFNSLCMSSSAASGFIKTRTAARLDLAAGNYIAEIRNMESQPGLDDVKTTVSLVSGSAK